MSNSKKRINPLTIGLVTTPALITRTRLLGVCLRHCVPAMKQIILDFRRPGSVFVAISISLGAYLYTTQSCSVAMPFVMRGYASLVSL